MNLPVTPELAGQGVAQLVGTLYATRADDFLLILGLTGLNRDIYQETVDALGYDPLADVPKPPVVEDAITVPEDGEDPGAQAGGIDDA